VLIKSLSPKDLADVIGQAVELATAPLLARVVAAEQKTITLEQRLAKCMHHEDVWREDQAYDTGAVVSLGGSAWVARAPTIGQRPGSGPTPWKLFAKNGTIAR
jgi:hypothetical protein